MNPLAAELNVIIEGASPALFAALSALGRELFYPKGILTQTAEAREKAYRYDATIGIARSGGEAMHLGIIMDHFNVLAPDQVLDYAPSMGNAALRAAWLKDMLAKNPSLAGLPTSLPVVTSGITHGLTISAELFCDPGDVVILPDKYWGNYNMVYGTRRGADIRCFELFDGSGGFNVPALARGLDSALDEKGKALLVLNFPNNPTGYSIRKGEADALVETLTKAAGPGRLLVVVLDDAYFGLFYEDDVLAESLFGRLAGADEHLIPVKLDGATKEEYAWGLRVGFITFGVAAGGREQDVHQALEKKVGGAVRGNISNCSQLGQSLLLAALSHERFGAQREEKFLLMKQRALAVREALSNPAYDEVWEPYPFNAGYFMCLRLKGIDAETLRSALLENYGVGVIADGGTDVRIAFSCLETEEIGDLFDIIYRCASELKANA
ncbi:MAG: aminotransferase class I/II-fold pyridoxal phosphate-dependent enzyme [Actinobacteria bacterium]|nr:aminotransferase class I/II-fold pyridoxal phosphate-dependent enzyme [Actinomycetota bacterium]MBU1945156.1 aminotransferase class I/II-fold pyridoxal phosphate-dependent enzyme [Actinomycetota bacterium]MBU2687694.1 aminotransferase class I/II-fold pyridoxal phosphate-dependent enzyme [Actinomycetota bacterium]